MLLFAALWPNTAKAMFGDDKVRLLIVEDEQKTGDYLKQGLSEAGFQVSLVRNGLDGIIWR